MSPVRSQPSLQRLAGRLGVVPVAGHDDVAADDDFAPLAGRELGPVLVDHADLDVGARDPGRGDPAVAARLEADVVGDRQHRDRHRRLALAVDLDEDRPEGRHRVAAGPRRTSARRRNRPTPGAARQPPPSAAAARLRTTIWVGATKAIDLIPSARTVSSTSAPSKERWGKITLRAPRATQESSTQPEPWLSGAACRTGSPASKERTSARWLRTIWRRLRWLSIAPFGRPVVPEV